LIDFVEEIFEQLLRAGEFVRHTLVAGVTMAMVIGQTPTCITLALRWLDGMRIVEAE